MAVLEHGERYYVRIDNGGDSYTRGRYSESGQFPYVIDDLDIVVGVFSDNLGTTPDHRYNIVALEAILDASDADNPDYGTSVETPNDNSSSNVSQGQGIGFEPRADLDGVRATISANVRNVSRAFIENADGERLAQTDISGLSAGDSFDLISSEGGAGGGDTDPGRQIRWSSSSDWQKATQRNNVVTQTFGVRSSDQIQQGWDPEHPPGRSFDAYWPLDETSGSTINDAIGSADGTLRNGATGGLRGLLGSNSLGFNGSNQYVDLGQPSTLMHSGSFGLTMGVRRGTTSRRETLMSVGFNSPGDWHLETRDDSRLHFFYVDSSGTIHSGSTHRGRMTTNWHYVGVNFLDSRDLVAIYLDGDSEIVHFDSPQSRPTPSRPAAIARDGDRSGFHFNGDLSDVIYCRGETFREHQLAMYSVLVDRGSLTTGSISQSGAPVSITTQATVPSNTSCRLEIRQDTSGSGSPDNTQTLTVRDGERTESLSGFASAPTATYSLGVGLDTNTQTRSAIFEGATLQFEDVAAGGGTVFRTINGIPQTEQGVIQTT
jgi:hypothetical protein